MDRSSLRDRPDLLILAALLGMQVWAVGGPTVVFYVLGGLIYLALDFLGLPLAPAPDHQTRRETWGYLLRWTLITLLTVPPMILLVFAFITERLQLGAEAVARNVTLVDSAVQIELAAQMILAGRNPYAEIFEGTAVALTPPVPGYDFNPAVFHYVYPPLSFLLPVPFYLLARATLGWFDLRLITTAFFLVVAFMLMPQLAESLPRRLALMILVLFNPAILLYAAQGQNEVFAFAWLVLTLVCLKQQRFTLALVVLGIGCALKQTIWFMVPFALVYLYHQQRPARWRSWLLRRAGLAGAPLALTLLPFAIWNFPALADDMLGYVSGRGAVAFPIMGYGLGQILLTLGLVQSPRAAFPFWAFQLALGLPMLLLTLRRLWRAPRLSMCAIGYGVFMLVFFFASRFFHDIYILFTLTLVAVGYLTDEA